MPSYSLVDGLWADWSTRMRTAARRYADRLLWAWLGFDGFRWQKAFQIGASCMSSSVVLSAPPVGRHFTIF